jgi:hypothetical protein
VISIAMDRFGAGRFRAMPGGSTQTWRYPHPALGLVSRERGIY